MKKFIIGFVVFILIIAIAIGNCSDDTYGVEESVSFEESEIKDATKIENDEITEEPTPRQSYDSTAIEIPSLVRSAPEQIIVRYPYTTSYNKDLKIPNWVAWHLTADHTDGPYKRLANFHEDEETPMPRATQSDYRGSGWSRGHMCPAGDNKWDEKAMYDTFSLVNVCPQNSSLNSGLWNSIEMDCRRWANQYGDIYIVCGPVFMKGEHETIGENRVVVPEAFFKVVLCLNGKPKAFGFIVRNTEGNKKRDLYYNSVDQVERITGIDFFPALPDDIENEVESVADINMWK